MNRLVSLGAAFTDFLAVVARSAYHPRSPAPKLDTRVPQMMNERSLAAGAQGKSQHRGRLTLYGSRFAAPQWGESTNVPFRYRIVVGHVEKAASSASVPHSAVRSENQGVFGV